MHIDDKIIFYKLRTDVYQLVLQVQNEVNALSFKGSP